MSAIVQKDHQENYGFFTNREGESAFQDTGSAFPRDASFQTGEGSNIYTRFPLTERQRKDQDGSIYAMNSRKFQEAWRTLHNTEGVPESFKTPQAEEMLKHVIAVSPASIEEKMSAPKLMEHHYLKMLSPSWRLPHYHPYARRNGAPIGAPVGAQARPVRGKRMTVPTTPKSVPARELEGLQTLSGGVGPATEEGIHTRSQDAPKQKESDKTEDKPSRPRTRSSSGVGRVSRAMTDKSKDAVIGGEDGSNDDKVDIDYEMVEIENQDSDSEYAPSAHAD